MFAAWAPRIRHNGKQFVTELSASNMMLPDKLTKTAELNESFKCVRYKPGYCVDAYIDQTTSR